MTNESVVAKIMEKQWPGSEIKYDLFLLKLQIKAILFIYKMFNIQ